MSWEHRLLYENLEGRWLCTYCNKSGSKYLDHRDVPCLFDGVYMVVEYTDMVKEVFRGDLDSCIEFIRNMPETSVIEIIRPVPRP